MKTIGLIGGTGWPSTIEYYRLINTMINDRLGGDEFARCVLYSVNYGDISRFRLNNQTEKILDMLLSAAESITAGGADCLLLCANTTHRFADEIQKRIKLPLLHIADAAAKAVIARNFRRVGLVGTLLTMEGDFYKDRLAGFGINTVIPDPDERIEIQAIIDTELLKGVFKVESRERMIKILRSLKSRGAEGIVLGCTEIPLIVKQQDVDIPLFDTLELHVREAVDFALR